MKLCHVQHLLHFINLQKQYTYIVWLEVDFLGIKTDTTTLKVTRIDLKTLNMKSEPEFKTFDTIVSTKSHEYMQDEARDCV